MIEVEDNSRGGGRGAEGCAICLEPISGESFLDQCFHRFCYHCILQWSEMVLASHPLRNLLQYLQCPLCKTPYTSIIHDLAGSKFQRHYILTSSGSRYPRLGTAHAQRQAVYAVPDEPEEQKPSRFSKETPKPNRWLTLWVQRELQAVMQEEDVETVTQHVVGVVEAFSKSVGGNARRGYTIATKDFDWHATISTAVRPFIFELAEKFAEELGLFLISGLDISAYDHRSGSGNGSSSSSSTTSSQLGASSVLGGDVKLTIDANSSHVSLKEIPCDSTSSLYDEDVRECGRCGRC